MDSDSSGNCLEEKLIYFIDRNDVNNVERLLKEGANATIITSIGRSAVGYATLKGLPNILKLLLWSCEDNFNVDDNECSEPKKLKPSKDRTPDGMEDLQWEEEIEDDFNKFDANDEWSKLYVYYARIFEKTGELLSNTIKKKDPHCLDSYSHAPLHYAAITGDVTCAELLLQYNSPVDITTKCGYTALHLAVKNPEITRCLLKRRANPNKYADHKQETPLHTAVRIGIPEVIIMLLDAGADINATCLMNRTPLILAIASKKFEIAKLLMDRGAKLNTQDSQGWTPLYVAVFIQNVEIVERLLQLGARLFVNHYLLHYCVREDLLDMIKVLVKYGDNIDIRNGSGWSPLLIAISERNVEILKFFIASGAKLNDNPLLKELHIAIMYCSDTTEFKNIAQPLISNGLDVNCVNYWGETPLHYTILQEKYEMTEFLIKEGADVNVGHIARTTDNIILARHSRNVDLMKLLIYSGLKIHGQFRPKSLQPPPWDDKNSEQYLSKAASNTLSLQQLTRITIRNSIIEKSKEQNVNCDGSIMKFLISSLHLPKAIQRFLYDFPDVPSLKNASNPTISSISSYEIQTSNTISGLMDSISRFIRGQPIKGLHASTNSISGVFEVTGTEGEIRPEGEIELGTEVNTESQLNISQLPIEVLCQIFMNLDPKDRWNCKGVCQLFNSILADRKFGRSICIHKPYSIKRDYMDESRPESDIENENEVDAFLSTFENSSTLFHIYCLRGKYETQSLQKILAYILSSIIVQDTPRTKLALTRIALRNSSDGGMDSYDISNLGKFCKMRLESLILMPSEGQKIKFLIPMSFLSNVSNIKIRGDFILKLDARIAPETLSLFWDDIKEENIQLISKLGDVFHIGQYIDGANMKILELIRFGIVESVLDLSSYRNLERLSLGVEVGKIMTVTGYHFDLKIKRLDLRSSDIKINLSILSSSLQQLNISSSFDLDINITIKCSEDDTFPQMKSLGLKDHFNFIYKCPNLIRLIIFQTEKILFDLALLPTSVKVIRFHSSNITLHGSWNGRLEKLIICHPLPFNWELNAAAIQALNPKIIVYRSSFSFGTDEQRSSEFFSITRCEHHYNCRPHPIYTAVKKFATYDDTLLVWGESWPFDNINNAYTLICDCKDPGVRFQHNRHGSPFKKFFRGDVTEINEDEYDRYYQGF